MSNETPGELRPHEVKGMPEEKQPWWFREAENDGFAHGQFVIDELTQRYEVKLSTEAKKMIWLSSMGTATEIACQTHNAIHHPESYPPKETEPEGD